LGGAGKREIWLARWREIRLARENEVDWLGRVESGWLGRKKIGIILPWMNIYILLVTCFIGRKTLLRKCTVQ
jgi:hypothetical protein